MSVKIRSDKNIIVMTRADTLITKINIVDADGNEYVPDSNDQLRFALKEDYNDKKTLIYKDIPIDTQILRVDTEDTKKLTQPGTYVFDIQLTYGDNIVDTIISGRLKLVQEVE